MSGNAYQCLECGRVEPASEVEIGGHGQWIRLSPISLVLVLEPSTVIRDEALFCSPDCVEKAMQKVKRV